jgi:hypothetical protein
MVAFSNRGDHGCSSGLGLLNVGDLGVVGEIPTKKPVQVVQFWEREEEPCLGSPAYTNQLSLLKQRSATNHIPDVSICEESSIMRIKRPLNQRGATILDKSFFFAAAWSPSVRYSSSLHPR